MSTIKVSNVQHGSAAAAAITLDANGQATLNGLAYPTSGSLSGRNRIINGDMRIDQRNTAVTASAYTVDRWALSAVQNSKVTVQKSTSVVPTGYTASLGATSSSAYSLLAADYFSISQAIEGLNVDDLAWGTINAKPVTLSFWVRSSLTGTFGGTIMNDTASRSYPFTYTINAANTWESKTITIPGDTTETWRTDNGVGIFVFFSLGSGSTFSGTANTWASANLRSATGATSVVGTSGATWQITGVQLEAGSVATPFERRSYGQELSLCQRYYYKHASGAGQAIGQGGYYSANLVSTTIHFPVTMRSAPSLQIATGTDIYVIWANNTGDYFSGGGFTSIQGASTTAASIDFLDGVSGTIGVSGRVATSHSSCSIAFSSEL